MEARLCRLLKRPPLQPLEDGDAELGAHCVGEAVHEESADVLDDGPALSGERGSRLVQGSLAVWAQAGRGGGRTA